ncbi:MAG: hypothetical protein AAGH64_11035 [Planctomycetota bacterium]
MSAPWRGDGFPRTVPVLAQLTEDEIAYLHWLASREQTRGGLIVDLGALAGGSAYAFANGSECHGESAPTIVSYDSFVATRTEVDAGLFRMAPGGSTLGVYERNLARFGARVSTRAMMIPEFAPDDAIASVYDGRAPVSVLFIDCAKAWGVHHTILRAFGPSLGPGSVVVQQDFRGPLVYLGLHMHQLAHRVRPVHSTFGASVGFEVVEPITCADVDGLWRPDDLAGDALHGIVDEAGAGLDALSPAPLAPWVTLAAGGFCAHTDRPEEAVGFVERAWASMPGVLRASPGEEARRAFAGLWRLAVQKIARQLAYHGRDDEAASVRALETWGVASDAGALRVPLWRQVAARCASCGAGRVALYGGGRHTDWLLHAGVFGGDARVVCVVDDAQERRGAIAGVPVVGPGEASGFDVVVPSSDAHEAGLMGRARALADRHGASVIPVYTEA